MTVFLSILLVGLGLLLWLVAGLLPVVKLRPSPEPSSRGVAVVLATTWMGAVTLSSREVGGVRDARFVQDPNSRRGGEVQVRREGRWERLAVGLLPDMTLQAQLAEIIRRLVQNGGPRELSLPMRGRMNLMLGFAVFFPLGTVCIFTGVLLLTSAL